MLRIARKIPFWGSLAFVVAVASLLIDYNFDIEGRTSESWQAVRTKAPGSSGKKEALEFLNSEYPFCVPGVCKRQLDLSGIDLSVEEGQAGVNLVEIDLDRAKLREANFGGADLKKASFKEADLRKANLERAKLKGVNFYDADLAGANFVEVDLSHANFSWANLRGAKFSGARLEIDNFNRADLRGADLSEALYLNQSKLDAACGDENTKLPLSLTVPMCDDVDWGSTLAPQR